MDCLIVFIVYEERSRYITN